MSLQPYPPFRVGAWADPSPAHVLASVLEIKQKEGLTLDE